MRPSEKIVFEDYVLILKQFQILVWLSFCVEMDMDNIQLGYTRGQSL